MTYREQFDSAMKCKTKEEAATWIGREIVRYQEEFGKPPSEARRIILANLGYMAGYYDHNVSAKVRDLFGALHPIFGDLATSPPTLQRAFEAGKQFTRSKK